MTFSEEITNKVKTIYTNLEAIQKNWLEKTQFYCPEGCGSCCINFEPEVFEIEAMYMAEWLIENQYDKALDIAAGNFCKDYNEKTCIFFNPQNAYHCSIYGGRPFICRLFGASSFHDKTGKTVWRPCKFIPVTKLQKHKPPLLHKQYNFNEAENILGAVHPVMSDIMEQAVSLSPDSTSTLPLRKILPAIIRKILFERQLKENV